jgi:hypothetical protein
MSKVSPAAAFALAIAFIGGFFTPLLYQRWNPPGAQPGAGRELGPVNQGITLTPQSHRVTFVPLAAPGLSPVEMPSLQARDVDKIRGLTGSQARIRGRVFRVGHSTRSNTYFLNFGPSREALTAVIFASAVELFEKRKVALKGYEGKEVEIEGVVKDHPQYGLEIVLENPSQIKIVS